MDEISEVALLASEFAELADSQCAGMSFTERELCLVDSTDKGAGRVNE